MTKHRAAGLCLSLALVGTAGCPPGTDGDADADADADPDAETCPAEAECCEDLDCSNGIFCDGAEICDRGTCEPSRTPRDCDDGRSCTVDRCDEMANSCVHEPNHSVCLDGDLCNGVERCAPGVEGADERGCVGGRPYVCDDGDRCTDDYCEDNRCLARIKDSDGDGYGDAACSLCDPDDRRSCVRGDDCDDDDPEVHPGATEVCDDGVDNDCDRMADYAEPGCRVPNDGCDEAMTLVPGVLVHSSTRGTLADVESSCSAPGDRDVVFDFTISRVQDVEVSIASSRVVTVALTPDCGGARADLKCTTGRTFTQINRALEPGTYFVVVSAGAEVDFAIVLEHSEPVDRPEGDQCETATDVSAGGLFDGTTEDMDPDYEATCGADTDRDATFVFTLAETSAVDIVVDAAGPVTVSVQSTCGVLATEAACFGGDPARGRVGSLPPGTHYIVVKGAAEMAFTLEVSFLETSADRCADALDISAGGTYFGTTAGMAADIATACGDETGPDSAYVLTLASEADLTVDFTSFGEPTTLSLTSACGVPSAELRCSTGRELQLRGRGLAAGTYYLVATGSRGADFELELTTAPPVARPADDLCSGAIDIPGSGSYLGDTFDCENDYDSRCGVALDLDSTYVFTLAEPASLELAVTGTSGPVTVAIQPDCGVVATERACFTASPSANRYFRSLDAGTYHLVFKTPVADSFSFDVTFGPAEATTMLPWIDPSGHTLAALTSPWSEDDGQYDIPIAPLAFPFNGTSYGCLAVSTNGYVRFGPAGACPPASGYGEEDTSIEYAFTGSAWNPARAQVSWLGADGYAGSAVRYLVDTAENRVVVTYLDHHHLSSRVGFNDVQLVFFCDTGDIQISYGECSFDPGGWAGWAIGVAEPAVAGGALQRHDFPGQTPGSSIPFGAGAISQSPAHTTAAAYLPLLDRGIFFLRSGTGFEVLVDDLPL